MTATTTTTTRDVRDIRLLVLRYLACAPVAGWYRWAQLAYHLRRVGHLEIVDVSVDKALARLVLDGTLLERFYLEDLPDRRHRVPVLYIDPDVLSGHRPERLYCWRVQPWAVSKPEKPI